MATERKQAQRNLCCCNKQRQLRRNFKGSSVGMRTERDCQPISNRVSAAACCACVAIGRACHRATARSVQTTLQRSCVMQLAHCNVCILRTGGVECCVRLIKDTSAELLNSDGRTAGRVSSQATAQCVCTRCNVECCCNSILHVSSVCISVLKVYAEREHTRSTYTHTRIHTATRLNLELACMRAL